MSPKIEYIEIDTEPTVDTETELTLSQAATAFVAEQKGVDTHPLDTEAREKIQTKVETITPAKARKYLTANSKNRDLRAGRVMQYAGDMLRDSYECTTDGIGFDKTGVLINGQHRLAAVVVADRNVDMVVVRGLSQKAQERTDGSLKRSLNDMLKIRGESYTANQAAALRWTHRLAYIEETGVPNYANSAMAPTIPQLLDMYEEHKDLRWIAKEVMRLRYSFPALRTGLTGALWYRFRQVDPTGADLFFEKLALGDDLDETDPIFLLRRAILHDTGRLRRMPDFREAAMIIKAWNLWRDGDTVKHLAFRYGSGQKEAFPIIH